MAGRRACRKHLLWCRDLRRGLQNRRGLLGLHLEHQVRRQRRHLHNRCPHPLGHRGLQNHQYGDHLDLPAEPLAHHRDGHLPA
jgi:hypothetical protein